MTVEELLAREAVRHTIAQYAIAGDKRDVDAFAGTFTEDGTLEMTTYSLSGRAAIRAWVADVKPFGDGQKRPAPAFMRHHLSTTLIEFTDAAIANARVYFSVMSDIGLDHTGYYVDRFRKEGERWLIAHRRVHILWRAENSYILPETVSARRKAATRGTSDIEGSTS